MSDQDFWAEQLSEARKLNDADLDRHATVSLRHRCRCGQCFCCAAVAVQRERKSDNAAR